MENKKITPEELEEKFYDLEEVLDDMLLTTYQNLFLLKDKELLKEGEYLVKAEKNIKSFGICYRELLDYDVAEPPVYGKIDSRIKILRKLLKKEWEDRLKMKKDSPYSKNGEDQDFRL